jgi:hypothetical protein
MAKKLNPSFKRSPHASVHENGKIDSFVASGMRRNSKQFYELIGLWQAKRADKLEELDRLQIEIAEKYRAAARAADKAKREKAKKQVEKND